MSDENSCETLIIGGGIAGLTCAWKLAQQGHRVALLEASGRWGGIVRTEHVEEFTLETGPNTVTVTPELEVLISELGLESQAIYRSLSDLDRFVFFKEKLHKVPTKPLAFLRSGLFTIRGKLRIVKGLRSRMIEPTAQETVGGYFENLMGAEFVQRAVRPGLAGVFASDAYLLGMRAALPRLCAAIRAGDSIVGAMKRMRGDGAGPRRMVSFTNGMETLPRTMAAALTERGVDIRLNSTVTELVASDKGYVTTTATGETWRATNVVLATSLRPAARLLSKVASGAAEFLAQSETLPMRIVHVAVPAKDIPAALQGFGFLCAKPERAGLLGGLWPDCIFPPASPSPDRVIALFFGGRFDVGSTTSHSPTQEDLKHILHNTMGFTGHEVRLLKDTEWNEALPVLSPDHGERIKKALELLPPGLRLLGNYYAGPAVSDRIREGGLLAGAIG